MQNQTSVHIAQPCHENWNNMTPTMQGKFCSACSKPVIDFSLLTDHQILTILSNQSGSLCGRFREDQLNRTIVETKVRKWKSRWLAYTLPFVLLFQKSFGQKNTIHVTQTEAHVVTKKSDSNEMTVGIMAIRQPLKINICGRVTDDKNNPFPNATIMIKGTNQVVISDSSGEFNIDVYEKDSIITLVAEYVGCETMEKRIRMRNNDEQISIIMQMQPAIMGEVVVVGYLSEKRTDRMGGVSVCRKITTTEKIDSVCKKVLRSSSYQVYPNPAARGTYIHTGLKKGGNYELQMMDNKSSLISIQQANNQADNTTLSFLIPGNISSGVYYLRIIDLDKKKSSVEKIIIE